MASASDNGGRSDGGSPDGLPDLPEEWGAIVIPDDLSELSDEVEAVRAELKFAEHPTAWRRLLTRPAVRRVRKVVSTAVRAPALIVSLAVLVTVASLFASAWPSPSHQPVVQRTGADDHLDSLPALELVDDNGQPVQLRAHLPAVVLLTDGCACSELVAATIAAAHNRPQIAVVVVVAALSRATASTAATPPTQAAPRPATPGQAVLVLHDPAPTGGTVRSQLKIGDPDGTAAALLVDGNGQVVHRITRTDSVDDIQPYLARI